MKIALIVHDLWVIHNKSAKNGSTVFNRQLFSNTKDATVRKGNPTKSSFFSPFVYLVPFVVKLFSVTAEEAKNKNPKRFNFGFL